jgi:EAL domain-containing protein (putative c-di-GMP-specific phosphodiesterase class I)
VFEDASDDLKHQLQALHDLGLRLSLDDFGTGYSSLSYLQQYPFDEIKVDKGFVQRMLTDPYSEEIVKTVIGIAEAVGADAVAEGVETTGERDALIALGCRIGQGFHYSMPLMEEDYRWLLEHRTPLPLIADTQDTTETDA